MNVKTFPSSLIKTLRGSIAGWASIVRFLVALKSNRDFDCFSFDQRMPCENVNERPEGKQRTQERFNKTMLSAKKELIIVKGFPCPSKPHNFFDY